MDNFIYNSTCYFHKTTAGNIINQGRYQFFTNNSDFISLLDIAEFTQTSKSYDEILDFANKREISHDLIKKAIQKKVILIDKDYKPRNNLVKRNKYFLDLLLDNPNNFNLEKEHIILVGCGGIGNFMSYPLSSLGIGEISLIDGDTIEESNLNRQFLFSRDDIGKNKVDTIERENFQER